MRLIQMSISAAAGVSLILLLRIFLFHRVSKKMFVLLWSVVILRLMLPVSLPVWGKFSLPAVNEIQTNLFSQMNKDSVLEQVDLMITEPVDGEQKLLTDMPDDVEMDIYISKIKDISHRILTERCILWGIWGIGMLIFLGYFVLGYRKESRLLAQSLPISEQDREYLNTISEQRWGDWVWVNDQIRTPVVYGIFNQKIILPTDFLTECILRDKHRSLYAVLAHEMVHVKLYDNARKMISRCVLCLHWFNPLVWIMNYYFQRDLELACDEQVLSMQRSISKKDYAHILLELAEYAGGRKSIFFSGFGRKAVTERMEAVMRYGKKKVSGFLSGLLFLAVSVCAFASESTESAVSINRSEEGTQIAIIGGADGPTSIFLAGKLGDEGENDVERVPVTEADMNRELDSMESAYSAFMDALGEYQKWELKYDAVNAGLYYNERPVGFLQDRISEQVYLYGYTDAKDEENAVALSITRDFSWNKMGITTMDMDDERVGSGIAAEDYEDLKNGMKVFDLQTMLEYASEDAKEYDALWGRTINEYYESFSEEEQPELWLPEHTVHLNRNMQGEEEPGTLWIRFTSVNDELEEDEQKKKVMSDVSKMILEKAELLENVEFSWSCHSKNPGDAYGTRTIHQMGIRFSR